MKKLLLTTLLILTCSQAWGACPGGTCIIRVDGGTNVQCLGGTDASFDSTLAACPSRTGCSCSLKHPFYAIGWWKFGGTNPPSGGQAGVMVGGDTVIIKSGSYKMGYDAVQTFGCSNTATYDCFTRDIQDGTSGDHTKIYGCSTSGCVSESEWPELWGSGRPLQIISLKSSDYVDIGWLEITDHAQCGSGHPAYSCGSVDANELSARDGFLVSNATNISLSNIKIHGLQRYGIFGGPGSNWTFTDIKLYANALAGFTNDTNGTCTNCGIGGTITWDDFEINYNGCVEEYPLSGTLGTSTVIPTGGCYDQNTSGYGDGIGLANTGGAWNYSDGFVGWNTSDGIDAIYGGRGSYSNLYSATFKRITTEGNVGAGIKTHHNAVVEDSLIIGNCAYHNNQTFSRSEITKCRGGTPLAFTWPGGSTTPGPKVINSTILSNFDVAIGLGWDGTCSAVTAEIDNSIFLGGKDFNGGDQSDMYYVFGNCQPTLDADFTICNNTRGDSECTGTGNLTSNPQFAGSIKMGDLTFPTYYTTEGYADELLLGSGSPARGLSDETISGADSLDVNSFDRGVAWDAGGLEFGTVGQPAGVAPCSAQTITNCDLDATASGASDGTCSSGYTGACSYSCLDGAWTLSSNTCVIQNCGNAQIDAGEECDGALLNGGTCGSEGYSTCAGTPTCTNCLLTQGTCAALVCGNNCVDSGEQCDGGNTTNFDGCSQLCENEVANYQHFKGNYTETDTPATMTVYTHRVQMNGITHVADSSVSKDFGASYFGNFTHRFKVQIDSCQDNGSGEDGGAAVWAMAGASYGDLTEMETADDGIALKLKCFSSVARNTWELIEFE